MASSIWIYFRSAPQRSASNAYEVDSINNYEDSERRFVRA